MCGHKWVEINDVRVCARCGLTVEKNTGKVMFDRKISNYKAKRRKGGKKA